MVTNFYALSYRVPPQPARVVFAPIGHDADVAASATGADKAAALGDGREEHLIVDGRRSEGYCPGMEASRLSSQAQSIDSSLGRCRTRHALSCVQDATL